MNPRRFLELLPFFGIDLHRDRNGGIVIDGPPDVVKMLRPQMRKLGYAEMGLPIIRSSGSPRASRQAASGRLADAAGRNADTRSVWARDGHAGAQVVAQHRENPVETCRPRLRPPFGGAA